MERKTFVKASFAIAAATTLPDLGNTIPRVLASGARKTKTITWWNWGDPGVNPNATAVNSHNSSNDAVKVFYERSHPGVVIDTTTYPYPDYVTALKTSLAGGSGPETVEMEPGPLITQYQPFLLPLDNYAEKRWGPQWREQFYPLAITQTLAADPQRKAMYALPIGLECGTALYYNSAIFAKYNLKQPQSYADLKNIADILNSHKIIPIAWGAKDGWPNFDWFRMLVEQTAPGVWDAALQGKAPFTQSGIAQALDILNKMITDRIFPSDVFGTTAYPEAVALFTSGKAAMYASGSWDLLASLYAPPTSIVRNNLGLFPLPAMGPGLRPGRLFGTTNMMAAITKTAADPQSAFDFVAWQAEAGQKQTWVDKSGFLPSRKGMAYAPMPNAHYNSMEQYFLAKLPHATIRYAPQLTAALQKATEDAIANVCTLGMSAHTALSAVQSAYNSGAKKR